jgi:hypothetical protein
MPVSLYSEVGMAEMICLGCPIVPDCSRMTGNTKLTNMGIPSSELPPPAN